MDLQPKRFEMESSGVTAPDTSTFQMTLATATSNFALLRALPARTKIYVDETTGQMSLENRYFSSARRWAGGTSRSDLVDPLKHTFDVMHRNGGDNIEELLSTFNHTQVCLVAMYPEFDALFEKWRDRLFSPPPPRTPPGTPPPPGAPPVSSPSHAVRRRGDVVIDIPVDFDEGQSDLIPPPDDDRDNLAHQAAGGCSGCCWRSITSFFHGIGKKRLE